VDPQRVLAFALGTQVLLGALAVAGSHLLGLRVAWGDPSRHVPVGIAAALALGTVNYALLRLAPPGWLADGVRRVCDEVLVPLFGRLNRTGILLISMAAGVGEEWFFRGVLQAVLGWVGASVVFGAAHVGGRHMVAFGVWATTMGLALGALAMVCGGLLAPAIAHGMYDALALEYLRRRSMSNAH
jgi:membrane protease YdiL (CAAX protease family)